MCRCTDAMASVFAPPASSHRLHPADTPARRVRIFVRMALASSTGRLFPAITHKKWSLATQSVVTPSVCGGGIPRLVEKPRSLRGDR